MTKRDEMVQAYNYGFELQSSKITNLFVLIDRIIKDNFLSTLEWESSKEIVRTTLIDLLVSASERTLSEIRKSKTAIESWSEIENGNITRFYYDREKKSYLSRHDTYITNDVLNCYKKIAEEDKDFAGKQEILKIFHDEYLDALSHEAKLECIEYHRGDIDDLLDLYNNPRYREVREDSIAPAISDKMAEQISLNEIKFKNIEEAEKAYKADESRENLAQLKKLYMIKAEQETEECNDSDELGKMLEKAKFKCVKRIIIRRLAYMDAKKT